MIKNFILTALFTGGLLAQEAKAPLQNFFNQGGPLPKSGPIQLQTHGAEISWRNIMIKEL